MILQNRAYVGNQYVYRAYYKNKIIWDHGSYTMGDLLAYLYGSAMPKVETPTAIQMHTGATLDGSGRAELRELDAFVVNMEAKLSSVARPNTAETVPTTGVSSAVFQAVAALATFGLVFTRGNTEGKLTDTARPHTAETVPGAGISKAELTEYARPYTEALMQILAAASGEYYSEVRPQTQEPEILIASTDGQMATSGCPVTLPIHTVTFMYNGEELHQTKAIDGYTCTDPLTTGDVKKQVKEMTPQYTFEHTGWSRTEGGAPDPDALANITEDTVLYAAFTETLRMYTVRFYDVDELVDTVSVPYGGTAVSTYAKKGYKISGYEPSNENITCDTDCTLQFVEFTLNGATWAEINEISVSGKAADYFSIGDKKTVLLGSTTYTVMIADFNHDTLYGSTKKAGITFICTGVYNSAQKFASAKSYAWSNSNIRTVCNNTIRTAMPTDLQEVIKTVTKGTYGKSEIVWVPSAKEIGLSVYASQDNDGTQYPIFTDDASRAVGYQYWTRTKYSSTSGYVYYVTAAGGYGGEAGALPTNYNYSKYIRFAFCV